jgi:NOL1/NOP2/sun family putative RNA methylase
MTFKPSPELLNLMEKLLGSKLHRFFEVVGEQSTHTIRFNLLKGQPEVLQKFLEDQGFEFALFPGFENIFRLKYQPYPIGKSLSHFLGHIYVQDLASMLPPLILNPQPGERVLDMSAAPGSKTTQMAVMMENRGLIVANDVAQKRLQALINNLQRFGIINCAVFKNYGESYGRNYFESFDKVLLDPACSGLGTLHKAPEILSWWSINHCLRLAASQKQLLISGIRALKPGGSLIYSTCTLTPWENEEIINEVLSIFPIELEKIDLSPLTVQPGLTHFDGKNFNSQLKHAIRLYPLENDTEGFFIAKLRKLAPLEKIPLRKIRRPIPLGFISDKTSPVKKYLDYFSDHFGINRKHFEDYKYFVGKTITAVSPHLADFNFTNRPLKTGLTIARLMDYIGKFTTEGTHLFGDFAGKNVVFLEDGSRAGKYVNREVLDITCEGQHQQLVKFKNMTLGYGLAEGEKLKSQFPKAGWLFKF